MKVSVICPSSDEEDEIIFRCRTLSDDMDRLIHRLRYGEIKFTGYDEHGISTIAASDIYYFETVDKAHVVRHFDVTGKACPAYWVDDKKWKKEFLDKL